MNKSLWIDHLDKWEEFLQERILKTTDLGDRIKYERQLKTMERVRFGAALNPKLLLEFINPPEVSFAECDNNSFHLSLNDSQKKAINYALGDTNLALIQGPPGTGKTQVITEICLQLLEKNPGIRVLVCSETHVAVNNLLSRIAEYNKSLRIVRIRDKENDDAVGDYVPENIIKQYLDWADNCISNRDAYSIIESELNNPEERSVEKALSLSADLVGMTCNKTAAFDYKDSTEMFDVAIIDEVCKATLPEILAPLLVARKAILLGDPRQLPPVFCSDDYEIIKSIEDCNLNKFMYIDRLFNKEKNTVVLNVQYRMSNQIGNMISDLFYNGMLENGRNEDVPNGLTWIDYQPSQAWPLQEEINTDRPQVYNLDECNIIENVISDILKDTDNKRRIAVISPYKAQIYYLRKQCNKLGKIKIDTVDGFQGKESDVVIFSTTRTEGSYRFLADERRLNVALSRAKDRIIIVGYVEYAKESPLLKSIIDRFDIISV